MMTIRRIRTAALVAYALLVAILVAPAAKAQDAVESQEAAAPPQSAEMRTFFGVPLDLSQRTAFVIDRSTAMTDYLDAVKAELKRALSAMTPEQQFRVVFFSDGPTLFVSPHGMQSALLSTVKQASERIDDVMIIHDKTDARQPVITAMNENPEVICVVAAGELDAMLPRQIAERPSNPGPTIHTVALGNEQSRDVLKALAERHHGTYRFIPPADLANGFKPIPLPSGPTRYAECMLMVRGQSRTVFGIKEASAWLQRDAAREAFEATVDPEGKLRYGSNALAPGKRPVYLLDDLSQLKVATKSLPDGHLVSLRLDITGENVESTRPAARECMRMLVHCLRSAELTAYENEAREYRTMIDPQIRLREESRRLLEAKRMNILNLRHTHQGPLSTGIIEQMQRDLEQMALQLELDLVGKEQRMVAVREQAARIPTDVAERLKRDAVIAELEKALAAREEQLRIRREQQSEGRASRDDVLEAEAQVVEIRTRLAERRELASHAAGGDLLSRLNSELAMLQIDSSEIRARRDKIQEQRDRLLGSVEAASQYQMMCDEQESLRKKLATLDESIAKLEQEISAIARPATIDVVGVIEAR